MRVPFEKGNLAELLAFHKPVLDDGVADLREALAMTERNSDAELGFDVVGSLISYRLMAVSGTEIG